MKNIRQLQYEKVRNLYQKLLSFRDEKPDQHTIEKLAREVLFSTLRTPLCGKYRLPRHNRVDTNLLNVECGLIKADSETIYCYIDQVQKKLGTIKYVADIWKQNALQKVKNTMMELAKMTAPAFIQGFTEELVPAKIMSQDNTTLVIDSDGSITLPMVVNKARRYKHRSSDISIRPIGDTCTATILGNPTAVVNMDENGSLTLTLSGTKVIEAGFEITINTEMESINYLYIQLAQVHNGIKIQARLSQDRKEYIDAYNGVITRNKIDIPVDEMNVRRLVLTLTMDAPNVVLANEVRYEFKIDKILMLSDKRKLAGRFQTKEINIENDVAYISIAAEDESIGDAVIKYYLATEKDINDNPTGFFFLDPHTEGSLVHMKSSTSRITIAPPDLSTPRWSLTGLKDYGSRLYNIFEICGSGITEETDDFKIENGRLILKQGELIKDTIKLYRGMHDYIKKEKDMTIERHVDWITILPEVNTAIDWLKRIPLLIILTELIDGRNIGHTNGAYYNQVTIPYTARNYEEIRVTREDGREINATVSNITYSNGNTIVTFAAIAGKTLLNPAYTYHISYVVALKEYADANSMRITIDLDSVRIGAGNDDLLCGADFDIHRNDMEIELKKSGRYLRHYSVDNSDPLKPVNNCTPLTVSYSFTGNTGKSIVYYETYIYAEVPMDSIIRPFTTGELAVGNFHIINGEHVGARTGYQLKQGWNIIETTQPYPSRNEYDPNIITENVCKAGIVIPEDVGIMRAYEDTMRQVAPFTLATTDREEGSKCFSFVDGQLLINFIPTSVEKSFLDDMLTSDMKGEKFLNKKAIWGTAYDNAGWVPNPESFSFEFSYTSSGTKKVFIRIDIACDNNTSIGRVMRLGLNKYKEV